MDIHTFGFNGSKMEILEKLEVMKSIIINNPQPNEKLNIEKLNRTVKLLNEFNNDIVGFMIVTLTISNTIKQLIYEKI